MANISTLSLCDVGIIYIPSYRMGDKKRYLTNSELQQLAENIDFDDDLLTDPYGSDDSIQDVDYEPSSDSDSVCVEHDYSENESSADDNLDTSNHVINPTDSQNSNIIWSHVDINNFSPKKSIPSDYSTTITHKLNESSNELDCFFSLFPKSLFMFMAHCTNQRLDILENERGKKKKKFTRTSAKELMLLTGVSLVMHYNRVPSFAMYWSTNPSLGNEAVKNAISRDRCQLLISKLYMNQPQKPLNSPKSYYIDEVVSCLKTTFTAARSDSPFQAIDESMAKFKGRSTLKQYMPLKPIKRGIKIWSRCDSSTGYVYDINIYTGKETNEQEGTLGERVVNKLASTIIAENVCLCFDRFFTSVRLLNELRFPALGTCMKNRKDVPKFEGKLQRGASQIVGNRQGIIAIRWQDTKDFIVLSNCHKPAIAKVKRKMKDGSLEEIDCPDAIKFYNEKMGGVDLADQMTSLYDIDRKSQKWWRKVYYKLLMMAVYNSFVVFREVSQKKTTFFRFLVALAEALITEGRRGVPKKRTRKVGRHSKSSENFHAGDHLPIEAVKRRRCFSCSKHKKEKRTKIMCKMCNIPLCMDCFTPYHT